MPTITYPADPGEAALRLFVRWFGAHYARSTHVVSTNPAEAGLTGVLSVGRQWSVAFSVVNTLAPEADMGWESARAALESRLDGEGRSLLTWVPRGAPLPTEEPAASRFIVAAASAEAMAGDRLEMRRPVSLQLRRTSTKGSVVTVLGGLSASWAQFTNRVPGSFQLNSMQLHRLPSSTDERDALAEQIVLAAGQPDVDESIVIPAEDVWTVNDVGSGGSCILGSPLPETDETSATLRRNLRRLLKEASPTLHEQADARALLILGASTYAEDEKLSWTLRGMDPALHAGYDIIAIVTDGMVKPLLQPGRQTLPWDAPLG
ncbi:MAG: hypothetical protein WD557_09885 [Dehalococcoidia bacterium]